MNKKKLICRISNGFGNQMFMYSASYSFSKQLNYKLFLDTFSGINHDIKKTVKKGFKHYKPQYELSVFNLTANLLPKNLTFDSFFGHLKRKFFTFLDKFTLKKRFIIENKDSSKKTFYDNSYLNNKFNSKIYVEGYFESEKYFLNYRSDLLNEFSFNKNIKCTSNYLNAIINSNSISLAIRKDRFTETYDDDKNVVKLKKTFDFEKTQYDYIINSINYFKKKVVNPKFFLFSDNFNELEKMFLHIGDLTFIKDYLSNKVLEDFFLMSKCKHFAVAPTSFHWWAAWLNNGTDKICLRPSNEFLNPSNNSDFWPKNWIEI